MELENNNIRFMDLFAGIGGFRKGLEEIGDYESVFSSEIDEDARKTYLANYGEMPAGDITKIETKEIPDHDLLCAGFPCQPFSISGKRNGFDDTRGTLFYEILRIAKEKRPEVLFLENVKFLLYHDKKRTFKVILDALEEELGYHVSYEVLNASDFGLPQNRERIIIASKNKKFDFEPIVKCTEKREKVFLEKFLDEEGDFEYLDRDEYTLIENPKLQKSGLRFVGYRNKSIRKKGVKPGTKHLSRVHRQPNRIYDSKGVHPTIPAQETSGRFFIYVDGRVRKLTLDECYKIMGFEDFKRVSSKTEQYKQIGNAIAVPVVKAVGTEIKKQIFGVEVENIDSYRDIAVCL